jgi:hypothetical protein
MGSYITLGNYFDKDKLLSIFDSYKEEKLRKFYSKKPDGTIIIERDYYKMYFSYEEGKDLFNTLPCQGYQFVYLPPKHEMSIHKDISTDSGKANDLKSRIGSLLQGSGDILFYDDEYNIIDSYNYDEDILTDIQVNHNVINNDEWRLTFFANFEESVDVINSRL